VQYQKEDLAYFPYQIEHAISKYKSQGFTANDFANVVIAGLGGSGIAGWIVKQLFYNKATIPVEVIGNYELPAYANSSTLLILSSYSGNTEETLAIAEEAVERGCRTCVMTTNGQLEEVATKQRWPIFYAEPGFQPRMALGYSLSYLMLLLGDLFGYPMKHTMQTLSDQLKDSSYFIEVAGEYFKQFKPHLDQKVAVVTDNFTYPAGVRFCQQMQENAKKEAFVHQVPEANHNVIESYYGNVNSVFVFLNSGKIARNNFRFNFLKDLLESQGNPVIEVSVDGFQTQDMLKLIFTLDWLALLTAEARNVNSLEIPNIKALKSYLASAQQGY
jgi:glucose/mannose-6-phosphate isomerase